MNIMRNTFKWLKSWHILIIIVNQSFQFDIDMVMNSTGRALYWIYSYIQLYINFFIWREETAGMCYWQGACLCCCIVFTRTWQGDTMYWQAACSLLLYIVIVRDQWPSENESTFSHPSLTYFKNFNQNFKFLSKIYFHRSGSRGFESH